MSAQTRSIIIGWVILLLAGCGVDTGGSCGASADCPGKLCLTEKQGYPGGYCSASCGATPCPQGQQCRPIAPGSAEAACLLSCRDASGCRSGYQCYQGVCQPTCKDDASCGDPGYVCKGGACVERPGAKVGAACKDDAECSSTICIAGACAQRCDREPACPDGQTCVLDKDAESLRAYCTEERGGKDTLAGCTADDQCDQGSCLMGACVLLCQTAADCAEPAAHACSRLPAPLSKLRVAEWPTTKVCLPRNKVMAVDLGRERNLLVPDTARSVLLLTKVAGYDEEVAVGMSSFRDAKDQVLYKLWDPQDPTGYFKNPIRHYPNTGCSSFLFSSSPMRAPVALGAYPFQVFAQALNGGSARAEVQAFYKLLDSPATKGKVPLRFHVTDLSGVACQYRSMTANNAQTMLSGTIQKLKDIYAQGNTGITLDPITFVSSSAPSSADAESGVGPVLAAATANTAGGLDVVLLRSITPNGVLGVAGGIPGSPGVKGTPHTGAVVSVGALCIAGYTQDVFAVTIAHELGHTLGLSHNREQNGQSDPLGDGSGRSESYQQNTDNLMYWAEGRNPGFTLTAEQGEVLRSMPQIQN